ncbi:MAG: hypothetical protein Q4G65_14900 [bacterium]|nr:hypothetical protein [bacterium]
MKGVDMYILLLNSLLFAIAALSINQGPLRRKSVVECILSVLSVCGTLVVAFWSDDWGNATVALAATLCVLLSLHSVGGHWHPVLHRLVYAVTVVLGMCISVIEFPLGITGNKYPGKVGLPNVDVGNGQRIVRQDGQDRTKEKIGTAAGTMDNDFARAITRAQSSVDAMYGEGAFRRGFESMKMDRVTRQVRVDVSLGEKTNLTLRVDMASPVPRVFLTTRGSAFPYND